MQPNTIPLDGARIAIITTDEQVITTGQSALDLAATVRYTAGADRLLIPMEPVADGFFVLHTELAGEVLHSEEALRRLAGEACIRCADLMDPPAPCPADTSPWHACKQGPRHIGEGPAFCLHYFWSKLKYFLAFS